MKDILDNIFLISSVGVPYFIVVYIASPIHYITILECSLLIALYDIRMWYKPNQIEGTLNP